MKKICLGDRVRDKVTGHGGIATARIRYLTGCDQIGFEAEGAEGEEIGKIRWFDIIRVEVIKSSVVKGVMPKSIEFDDDEDDEFDEEVEEKPRKDRPLGGSRTGQPSARRNNYK